MNTQDKAQRPESLPVHICSCLDRRIGVVGPAPAASLVDASAWEMARRDEGVALSRLAVTPKSLSTTRPSWLMRTFAACTASSSSASLPTQHELFSPSFLR